MPFSPSIRDKALVAAARHCCVCHRYKGINVEVHHIVLESQGGSNDLENAIALCFDCHADAGHYNPRHPKGTKFSPSELKLHRDTWHMIVKHHSIQPPDAPDLLYCRYLLCKSFDMFREITLGDLSQVPVEQPFLVENSVRRFQGSIVEQHHKDYRHEQEWGDHFPNHDEYSRIHPEIRVVERSSINVYPYFQAIRVPSLDELREKVGPNDVITRLLVETGVLPQEISLALAYNELCGDERFQEVYRLRPLWALYLAATNLDSRPLPVKSIIGEFENPEGICYRSITKRFANEKHERTLPKAPLPPGATLLVPLATLLGPVRNFAATTFSEQSNYLSNGQGQVVRHEDLTISYEETSLIGPSIWPNSLRINSSGITRNQYVHEFDLSNLFTITRFWEVGSCPHLFAFEDSHRPLRYLGELFAHSPGIAQVEHFIVPGKISYLLIAELEKGVKPKVS
jgi:hypothetical protein